jgi:glycosyltransferase involved in cell wall biosynthesis
MKKILIVTEHFYPVDNSTSYYLTNIAIKLAENNNVRVICNTNLNDNIELNINNLSIIRSKEVKLSKNNIITRSLKFLISSIKLSILTSKNIETNTEVLSVTNPAFIIVFLSILKKIKNFNYKLIVYDVFPENLIASNILKKRSFFYRTIKRIYDWSYLKADQLIVIGRDMQDVIKEKTNNNVPIILIENWCDYQNILPSKKKNNKILENLNILDKKVFLFAGNLGRVQGIENILQAAELVNKENFIFLFIGDGTMKNDILKHILTSKIKNVIYGGSFPMNQQNLFLNACDVSVVSLADSMYGLGVPSKTYFNMAAAKPILYIGDKNSEIARVINENKIGWIVENSNPEALSQIITKIIDDFDNYENIGIKSRKVLEQNYSQEIILNKYKKLYE